MFIHQICITVFIFMFTISVTANHCCNIIINIITTSITLVSTSAKPFIFNTFVQNSTWCFKDTSIIIITTTSTSRDTSTSIIYITSTSITYITTTSDIFITCIYFITSTYTPKYPGTIPYFTPSCYSTTQTIVTIRIHSIVIFNYFIRNNFIIYHIILNYFITANPSFSFNNFYITLFF